MGQPEKQDLDYEFRLEELKMRRAVRKDFESRRRERLLVLLTPIAALAVAITLGVIGDIGGVVTSLLGGGAYGATRWYMRRPK